MTDENQTPPRAEEPGAVPSGHPPRQHEPAAFTRAQFYMALIMAAVLGGLIAFFAANAAGWRPAHDTEPLYKAQPASAKATEGLTPAQVYQRAAAGTVYIQVARPATKANPEPDVVGSGILIDGAGDILTNDHVVSDATSVEVTFASGAQTKAQVIGEDPSVDLALIRVNPAGLILHPLVLGDSSTVYVGQETYALGAPFSLQQTFTSGIISALDRDITAPNGFSIGSVLQTDTPINPGNSGGPLLDGDARVVGINAQIQTDGSSGGNLGIGFAIPINLAKRILPKLEAGGTVHSAYLGVVGTSTATLGSYAPKRPGAVIESVVAGGPAAKAGLRGGHRKVTVFEQPVVLGGDEIIAGNGQPIHSMDALIAFCNEFSPGQTVTFTVVRSGKTLRIPVVLGTNPNHPQG